jgi:hypothetical protein
MVSHTSSDIETQKSKEKCQALLNLSSKIRYVGIINDFGRTLAGQLRRGTVPLFKVEEARNEFFIEATRNRLRRHFEYSIGKMEFGITVNEKVIILVVPSVTSSHLYYFTFDKDATVQEITQIKETATRSIITGET